VAKQSDGVSLPLLLDGQISNECFDAASFRVCIFADVKDVHVTVLVTLGHGVNQVKDARGAFILFTWHKTAEPSCKALEAIKKM